MKAPDVIQGVNRLGGRGFHMWIHTLSQHGIKEHPPRKQGSEYAEIQATADSYPKLLFFYTKNEVESSLMPQLLIIHSRVLRTVATVVQVWEFDVPLSHQ